MALPSKAAYRPDVEIVSGSVLLSRADNLRNVALMLVLCRYVSDSAFSVVSTPLFGSVMVAVIAANAIALATQHRYISDSEQSAVDAINFACTIIFAVEMLLKLLALGCSGYIADNFNLFDGVIVILSVADVQTHGTGISVFRLARVLRLFRLARRWRSMRTIVEVGDAKAFVECMLQWPGQCAYLHRLA